MKEHERLDKILRALDLDNHQSIVDFLFEVQTGHVSCRRAATEIQGLHNGDTDRCESCSVLLNDKTYGSDGEGVPLCPDCLGQLEEEAKKLSRQRDKEGK